MHTHRNAAWPQLFLTPGRALAENRGEDSYCYSLDPENRRGLIAVMDGCGGSGARRHRLGSREGGATGAYIASRVIARALHRWYTEQRSGMPEAPLHDALSSALRQAEEVYPPVSSLSLGGSIVRKFPTTLSAALVQDTADGAQLRVIWAGDSRCYLLTADGLKQLTRDDLTGQADAMENIFFDSPLRNVVCADRPFVLNERRLSLREPYILLTATDGFYGCFPSPMDFEHFLLRTLCESETPDGWKDGMQAALDPIVMDDCQAVILGSGWRSFSDMRSALGPRLAYMESAYIAPMNEHTPRSREQMMALWQRYKSAYEGACEPE